MPGTSRPEAAASTSRQRRRFGTRARAGAVAVAIGVLLLALWLGIGSETPRGTSRIVVQRTPSWNVQVGHHAYFSAEADVELSVDSRFVQIGPVVVKRISTKVAPSRAGSSRVEPSHSLR